MKRIKKDCRLDWRDKNMPVLRFGYLQSKIVMYEVNPVKIEAYYQQKMLNHPAPDWKNDPTYDLKGKKK